MSNTTRCVVSLIGFYAVAGLFILELPTGNVFWKPSVLTALVSSEAALLGFWGATEVGLRGHRLAGAIVGLLHPMALLTVTEGIKSTGISHADGSRLAATILVTFVAVFGTVTIARFARVSLWRIPENLPTVPLTSGQFSIRQLMVLTAAVSSVLAFALRFASFHDLLVLDLPVLLVDSVYLALGPLIALAALGLTFLLGISTLLTTSAISPAALLADYLGTPLTIDAISPAAVFVESLVSLGSLLMLRSCGYRLSRASSMTVTADASQEIDGQTTS